MSASLCDERALTILDDSKWLIIALLGRAKYGKVASAFFLFPFLFFFFGLGYIISKDRKKSHDVKELCNTVLECMNIGWLGVFTGYLLEPVN